VSEGVVIDARWLRTGIGRYTLSLLHGLRESLKNVPLTCITQPRYVDLVSDLCERVVTCDANIYGVKEQLALPWLARAASALYAPHYNIPLMWRRKLLVTIHDLNHLLDATYRGSLKSRLYAKPFLSIAARNADVVITPSEYTKAMISEHLHTEPARISVIPGCVASCFRRMDKNKARLGVAGRFGITRPYLLFVGSCAPNKNVPLLLESVARLRGRRKDAPLLVLAGNDDKGKLRMQDYGRKLGLQDHIVWLERINDGLLAELYSAALMTVVPSFEEGFGLPVIESMACGTPVVCSQAASLPEVAGDAALFFSPHSCEQLITNIEQLMDSAATQETLIAAGLARSSLFSRQRFGERQAAAVRKFLLN
jgi:glycosyltransferase involved in cell wall biosynthesis